MISSSIARTSTLKPLQVRRHVADKVGQGLERHGGVAGLGKLFQKE